MIVPAAALLVLFLSPPSSAGPDPAGVWEGEIEDPGRPFVFSVDFNARTASMSGAGPDSLAIRDLSTDGDEVRFEMTLEGQSLRFSGRRHNDAIRGQLDVDPGDEHLPFWLERLPERPPPGDRVEAWRQDLDVVRTRFLRYDRSFTRAARAAAKARLDRLAASVGHRADAEVLVELARIIALGRNAHTRLYLVRNRTEVRRLPIRVWWFRDQLRVVRAASDRRDLLGCRIVEIAGVPASAAARRVRGIKAGNRSWQRYLSAYFLTSPEILFAVGLIPDAEHVPLTVACPEGSRDVRLAPLPLVRRSTPVEAWWDLVPSYPHPDPGFESALAPDRAPRYLRHADRNYWFVYLPEEGAIYFQYNRAQEMPDHPMAAFTAQLARAIDGHRLEAFIVDLRFNTGGDLTVATPLVEALSKKLRGVPVHVLTGRATFSAGISHAAQWKQLAGATVVGEPAGDGLDTWSEGGNLILPNSGVTVHYANAFHAYSRREYPRFRPYHLDLDIDSLAPAVLAESSWADYLAGRDPVYEAAAARIAHRKGRPAASVR